ncbi:MAG: DHH family phosphoesterase [Chitinophagaceae bacterium]
MKNIQLFYSILKKSTNKKITIIMHRSPDGDALGSSLAMQCFLEKFDHQVVVISPTEWPHHFNWMPHANNMYNFECNALEGTKIIEASDWIFCMDFNHISRIKNVAKPLQDSKAIKILIDHHETPMTAMFDYGISIPQKSSTCEMVYDFIVEIGYKDLIDEAIRKCIYTGIITDTGSFRYKGVTPHTHQIASEFLAQGLQQYKIHDDVFDTKNERIIRLLGHLLCNRLTLFEEYKVALICINKEDFKKFKIRIGDTEGIVNYPLRIKGYEMAALVVEKADECKWSFRSKGGGIDVNTFAKMYFSGGGHLYAAGGISYKNLEKSSIDFQHALKQYFKEKK